MSAAALSLAAFIFIIAVSIAPDGPRTSGFLSTCSMYAAVALSHASKPFFHTSQPIMAVSSLAEAPNLGCLGEILLRLVIVARRAGDLAEALEHEGHLPLERA